MEFGKLFLKLRKRKTSLYSKFVNINQKSQQVTKTSKLCQFLNKYMVWLVPNALKQNKNCYQQFFYVKVNGGLISEDQNVAKYLGWWIQSCMSLIMTPSLSYLLFLWNWILSEDAQTLYKDEKTLYIFTDFKDCNNLITLF